MKPYAVVFSGVPGSSKSIVAFYLSGKFGLPIFSNDQLRYEVKEDMLINELILPEDLAAKGINVPEALAEFERRLTQRVDELLSTKRPIVLDGSVDRRWEERKSQLKKHGYDWFLINMELSRQFLEWLFSATGRSSSIPQLDRYIKDHQEFLEKYDSEINLEITDNTFKDRLILSEQALKGFITSNID